jgi:hypothetical protein
MKGWVNLLFAGRLLLGFVPFVPSCCDQYGCGVSFRWNASYDLIYANLHSAGENAISPEGGSTMATLPFGGANLTNPQSVIADGEGLTVQSWTFSNGEVQVTFNAANNAVAGAHTITAFFGSNGNVTELDSTTVYVTCNTCVPPPRLSDVVSTNGSGSLTPGQTKTVRFIGRDFLSNSPVVQLDSNQPGLSLPPNTTITVQRQGTTDYFDVPIVVAADAVTGLHQVRVLTSGGRTAWGKLIVASPGPTYPPGSVPVITSVTPSHIAKGVLTEVKVEGSGFGTSRAIYPTSLGTTWQTPVTNPDHLAVIEASSATSGPLSITVHNLTNGMVSAPFTLFVDEPDPGRTLLAGYQSGGIGARRGLSTDLDIYGDNLTGATDAGWSGSSGLTFANTQVFSGHVTVHVAVDATASLTAEEATNITLTTAAGQSPPYRFRVLP